MASLLLFKALTDKELAELSEGEVREYAMAAGRAHTISVARTHVQLLWVSYDNKVRNLVQLRQVFVLARGTLARLCQPEGIWEEISKYSFKDSFEACTSAEIRAEIMAEWFNSPIGDDIEEIVLEISNYMGRVINLGNRVAHPVDPADKSLEYAMRLERTIGPTSNPILARQIFQNLSRERGTLYDDTRCVWPPGSMCERYM